MGRLVQANSVGDMEPRHNVTRERVVTSRPGCKCDVTTEASNISMRKWFEWWNECHVGLTVAAMVPAWPAHGLTDSDPSLVPWR